MSANEQSPVLASITFLTGLLAGTTVSITRTVTTIGRDSANDVVVKGDQQVSRHHARLVWANGVWSVENISEHNWITVNQRRLQQASLQDQATIGLGKETTFVFTLRPAAQEPAPPPEQPTQPALPESALPTQAVLSPEALAQGDPAFTPTKQPAAPALPSLPPGIDLPASMPGAYISGGPVSGPSVPDSTTRSASPAVSWLDAETQPAKSGAGLPDIEALSTTTLPQVETLPAPPEAPALREERATSMMPRPSQTMVAAAWKIGIATLEVSDNTTGQRRSYPLDKKTLSIGREASNDIVIDERCISGQHLQLAREGQQIILIHPHPARQRTTHGLLYQGRKIRGDESFRKALAPGDVFRISDESGTLVTLTYHDASGAQPEEAPAMRPIKLEAAEITIGRKDDNAVVLPHPLVSAHHARLVREGGAYRILDLHSTNHIYVNSELVTSHLLKLGDEIRIGPYRLVYESTQLTQYDETKSIRIDALNLRKMGAKSATLLNNISLSIPPRAFVALVGGSGAGKSTLMDALSGLRLAEEGKVLYNGQDYYRNLAAFNTQIGYVPQEDIVHRELTVERALYYAARMRLPRDFTEEQIWQRIGEVLEDVELTERRGSLIKKLSGGQRKRVSIALELLANPSLFFLDEPTSGLDPGLDRKMMVLLRKLADKGHTVILVTHATNNINVCDYVCFLAPGGRLGYFGPPDGAKAYFGKTEFAEIYSVLEVNDEQPNAPEEAEARYKVSEEYQQYVAQPLREAMNAPVPPARPKERKRTRRGSAWDQFWLLSVRRLELLRNDLPTLLILLLEAPLVALLLIGLIRVESGAGILEGDNIIQCQPQIRLPPAIAQQMRNPQGILIVPVFVPPDSTVSCATVQTFLQNDPQGQQYAAARGGVAQALQDFEVAAHNGDAQRLVFMLVLIPIMFGNILGSREIVKETAIYRRERAVSLRIVPYLLSKILVFGVLAVVQAAEVVVIVQLFEPFHQGIFFPPLVEAFITLSLAGIGGLLWGYLVSAISPNEDTANSLIAAIIVPPVIFSGVILSMHDLISQVVAMIFPLRWGMAALGSSLGLHSDKIGGDKLFGNDYLYHPLLYSTYTQVEAANRVIVSWIAMGVITLVLALIIGFFLKRRDVRR
jgi:ABC-type multidrug transport system ATPase subunit/pSer/pThr/pTyr-binding forkhead associated (FHA) protein